jgi:hypothetical protein
VEIDTAAPFEQSVFNGRSRIAPNCKLNFYDVRVAHEFVCSLSWYSSMFDDKPHQNEERPMSMLGDWVQGNFDGLSR